MDKIPLMLDTFKITHRRDNVEIRLQLDKQGKLYVHVRSSAAGGSQDIHSSYNPELIENLETVIQQALWKLGDQVRAYNLGYLSG